MGIATGPSESSAKISSFVNEKKKSLYGESFIGGGDEGEVGLTKRVHLSRAGRRGDLKAVKWECSRVGENFTVELRIHDWICERSVEGYALRRVVVVGHRRYKENGCVLPGTHEGCFDAVSGASLTTRVGPSGPPAPRSPTLATPRCGASPSLPEELLDHIVDHLHNSEDALKSRCIIPKSWTLRARRHLFARVRFHTPESLKSWKERFSDSSTSPTYFTEYMRVDCPQAVASAEAG